MPQLTIREPQSKFDINGARYFGNYVFRVIQHSKLTLQHFQGGEMALIEGD